MITTSCTKVGVPKEGSENTTPTSEASTTSPSEKDTSTTGTETGAGEYNKFITYVDNSKPNLAKKRAGAEDTLIVGYASFPSMKLLPIEAGSTYDRYFVDLIFTDMLIAGPDAQPVFNYATAADSVDISEDKLTYTYHLTEKI